MRGRLAHRWVLFALVPALIALTCETTYALFRCEPMQRVQSHCCCSAEANGPVSSEACIERASCCSEEVRSELAPQSDLMRAELRVLSPVTVSLIPMSWLFPSPATSRVGTFAHPSRAQGPPLVLVKQSLLR